MELPLWAPHTVTPTDPLPSHAVITPMDPLHSHAVYVVSLQLCNQKPGDEPETMAAYVTLSHYNNECLWDYHA